MRTSAAVGVSMKRPKYIVCCAAVVAADAGILMGIAKLAREGQESTKRGQRKRIEYALYRLHCYRSHRDVRRVQLALSVLADRKRKAIADRIHVVGGGPIRGADWARGWPKRSVAEADETEDFGCKALSHMREAQGQQGGHGSGSMKWTALISYATVPSAFHSL